MIYLTGEYVLFGDWCECLKFQISYLLSNADDKWMFCILFYSRPGLNGKIFKIGEFSSRSPTNEIIRFVPWVRTKTIDDNDYDFKWANCFRIGEKFTLADWMCSLHCNIRGMRKFLIDLVIHFHCTTCGVNFVFFHVSNKFVLDGMYMLICTYFQDTFHSEHCTQTESISNECRINRGT